MSDTTAPNEFTVTDELYEISEATNSDGTVNVNVYDFEKADNGNNVEVHFHTPTLEKKSEKMEWPKKDSHEYKFVRLCRKTVGGLNGAEWLKQDGAEIQADPDNWSIEADLNRRDSVKSYLTNMTLGRVILMFFGMLTAIWILMLATVVVGIPLLWFLSFFGVDLLFGGMTAAWITGLTVGLCSLMILGGILEDA